MSAALTAYYNKSSGFIGLAITGGLWVLGAVVLTFVPQVQTSDLPWTSKLADRWCTLPCTDLTARWSMQAYKPAGFSVPLMPWIPAGSIILNTFLMGAPPCQYDIHMIRLSSFCPYLLGGAWHLLG